jgi:iron(III) transport system substrate-binding protein
MKKTTLLPLLILALALIFLTVTSVSALAADLVVYSAGPKSLSKAVVANFEKKTGLKVQLYPASTGKVLAKLEAEKHNPIADVVVLASWAAGLGLKDQKVLAPINTLHRKALRDEWVDSHLIATGASAMGIAYNTKLVKNPPKDWWDMANPEWTKQVNMPSPTKSGSCSDFVTAFIGHYGDRAWKFFENLRDNGANIAGPNNQALTPVLTGARKTVFAAVDYITYKQAKKGESVNIAYPASGTVVNPRPIVVLKSSKHMANAQKFVDYYLSPEGQKLVVDTILIPARTDMKVLDLRVGLDQIKTIPVDWAWLGKNQQQVISKFYREIETGR